MKSEKIGRSHLERAAYVYVRQSSLHQVRDHQESTRRQYELESKARAMGFSEVVVIDDDLGVSGSGKAERPGFGRMLSAICEGKVGAVVALEASRFARNGHEWHRLIELCRLSDAVVIDLDRVYDPADPSDRLMLGVMGSLSEFETGQMRKRGLQALEEKAHRGELHTNLPIGFVYTEDGQCEKIPDKQIQAAIEGMFRKFAELGSARQVALWYQKAEIPFPKAKPGRQSSVRWVLPEARYILSLLKNPTFAGAYAWGRSQTRTRVVDGRERRTTGHDVPRDKWPVLIRHHHPGYISWEEYEANQEKLASNTLRWGLMGTGPARSGEAMLTGLLRCGRCWRKLQVVYKAAGVGRYQCRPEGRDQCAYSFSYRNVDEAVCNEVLWAVQPAGAAAAMQALERLSHQNEEEIRQLSLAVEKARYQADRCRRQFNAVEPENRLVAATIEGQWNDALIEVRRLEAKLEQLQQQEPNLAISPEERQRLLELGDDLETVWYHPNAQPELKKRILRTVLEEIIVEPRDDPPETLLHLHWAGGVHTELQIPRLGTGKNRNATPEQVVDLIRQLAKFCDDQNIAAVLNRSRINTGRSNTWNRSRVQKLRSRRKIPAFRATASRTWVNLSEAAKELGVSPPTVRALIRQGILPGRQIIRYAPWIIERSDLDLPGVRDALRGAPSHPTPQNQNQDRQLPLFATLDL